MLVKTIFNDKSLISVFLLSLLVCGFFIHGYPIYILDEAKNSEAAREMFLSGDWLVPKFNDVLRTAKPPLHYFFMILGYEFFGVNPLGARLFSSVFGALTFSSVFFFAKKFINVRVASISWFVLLSAVFFVQLFHQSVPDPYLIFFVSVALFCFIDFYKYRKKISLTIFYAFLGLGTLSKGPVAIALPGLIVFLFLLTKKEVFNKKVFQYYPILGIILMLLVAAPWYIAVHKATDGAWTEGFFLNHNINRFNSEMEGHGGIFLVTWAFVILGLLPFSVFIIQAFKRGWIKRKDSFISFSLISSAVFIIFFSVSGTKLPNYTMPCYPFIAILLGIYLNNIIKGKEQLKWFNISLISILVISVVLPIGAYFAFSLESQLQPIKWLSVWLIIAPIGCIISYYFFKRKDLHKSIVSLGFSWIVLGAVIFGCIYPKMVVLNPVSKALEIIPKGADIVAFESFDAAFPFNYERTFEVINSEDDLKNLLIESPNTYIITNKRNFKDVLENYKNVEILLEYKALFENHKTLVFKSSSL